MVDFGGGGPGFDLLDAVLAALEAVINAIADALWSAIKVLIDAVNILAQGAKVIADALRGLWNTVLKPLLARISAIISRLHRIYNRIIRPILDQIQRQRDLIRRIYALYFRPILEIISALRTFLAVTRLNNTAFGRAVDRRLADLEAKVYAPIKAALKTINDQARYLNILLGPDLLFQQWTHVQSVIRDMGHISRVFYNRSRNPFPHARDLILARIASTPPLADEHQAFKTFLASGGGRLSENFARDNTEFRRQLAAR